MTVTTKEPERPLRGLMKGMPMARISRLSAASAMPIRQPNSPKLALPGLASNSEGCMDWASDSSRARGTESMRDECDSNSITFNSFFSVEISTR